MSSNNSNPGSSGGFLRRLEGHPWTSGRVMLIIVIIIVLYIVFGQSQACTGVTRSTVKRTKIVDAVIAEEPIIYHNDLEGWTNDSLDTSMQTFYATTGVMPYLYILPENGHTPLGEVQNKADELYAQMFVDEGHFVAVFQKNESGYLLAYHVGEEAKKVLDEEALTIFDDYIRKNLNTKSIINSAVFPNVYTQTASTIMTTSVSNGTTAVVIVLVLILLLYFGQQGKKFIDKKNGKEETAEEQAAQPQMLFPKYDNGEAHVMTPDMPEEAAPGDAPAEPAPEDAVADVSGPEVSAPETNEPEDTDTNEKTEE